MKLGGIMTNWLLIIVLGIFLLCVTIGAIRGLLKTGVSLIATVLTVMLMLFINPFITEALIEHTPVARAVENRIYRMFVPRIDGELLKSLDLTGTRLEHMTVDQLENFDISLLQMYGLSEKEIFEKMGDIPLDVQERVINDAPIAQFMRDLIRENNNPITYQRLGVSSFPEYAASFITHLVVAVASFIISFLLAIILVKALIVAVDIIGELPLIGPINHIAGGVFGIGIAVVFVWILFIALTLLYNNEFANTLYAQIEGNGFLMFLYRNNMILHRLTMF